MDPPQADKGGARGAWRSRRPPFESDPSEGSPDAGPDRGAIEGTQGELVAVSRGGRVVWLTAALRRLLGWTGDRAGSSATFAAPDDETAARVSAELRTIKSGETRRLTAPILASDGEVRWGRWAFTRHRGRVYHYCLGLWRRCSDCDGRRCETCERQHGTG